MCGDSSSTGCRLERLPRRRPPWPHRLGRFQGSGPRSGWNAQADASGKSYKTTSLRPMKITGYHWYPRNLIDKPKTIVQSTHDINFQETFPRPSILARKSSKWSGEHGWVNVRTTTRSRSGGPIPAPSLYCVFRTFTHTPHHTGWHTRRRFELLSEAYWFVRALGPISGCRGSHGGSGGDRSERYPRADRNLATTPFAESGRCR